ncbi:hypothetical protein D3C76_1434940 [compost metagenome]
MFGEVQRGLGEPAGIGHLRAFAEHLGGRGMPKDLEIVGKGLPEGCTLLDAPAVQVSVIFELQVVAQVDPAAEGIHPAGFDLRRGGAPEHIVHAEPPDVGPGPVGAGLADSDTREVGGEFTASSRINPLLQDSGDAYSALAFCTSSEADHTR